jgi:hypothetical protein
MLDLIFSEVFEPQHLIAGILVRADELIQFQLNCRGVAVCVF